jgi:hypothetical protein
MRPDQSLGNSIPDVAIPFDTTSDGFVPDDVAKLLEFAVPQISEERKIGCETLYAEIRGILF